MKKAFALLILAALAVGGYFAYEHYIREKNDVNTDILTLYGNVDIRRTNLGFRVSGRISEFRFEEGDRIREGETVAAMDREPYEDAVAVAAAQVEHAEVNYEKLLAGNRPQEIEQARATLAERIASLTLLESDLRRVTKLVKDAAVSQEDYETVLSQRNGAAAQVDLARATLDLQEEGYRKEDIAMAKSQLSEARANLKKAQTNLDDTVLKCPNDGVLLTRVEEPGAVVAAGQIVATLSLTHAVWVYVYVPETQLGEVAPGMKAEIFTDTHPEKPYLGHVGYISPQAEFTPKTVETTELRTNLVYRVRIIADAPDDGLRQGMPVTVRLALNQPRETQDD